MPGEARQFCWKGLSCGEKNRPGWILAPEFLLIAAGEEICGKNNNAKYIADNNIK